MLYTKISLPLPFLPSSSVIYISGSTGLEESLSTFGLTRHFRFLYSGPQSKLNLAHVVSLVFRHPRLHKVKK